MIGIQNFSSQKHRRSTHKLTTLGSLIEVGYISPVSGGNGKALKAQAGDDMTRFTVRAHYSWVLYLQIVDF